MKVNDISEKFVGRKGNPTPVMQYRAGYAEKGCENGLNMVRHTAMFYSEESLLEYLNGETKSMVEELAAMQGHGHAYVIRRHNEISKDTETLFKNMHPSLHFKFMDIILGFTNNKVVDMNGYLEASDDGKVSLMRSSVPCAVDGTVRYNHFDALQGAIGFFIVKITATIDDKKACLGLLENILENYMEMPVQILWIIAEDDEDELTMHEVLMFNTVRSEENHVPTKGLPGWNPPATDNPPSLEIALGMKMELVEKNTICIEPLIRGTTLIPLIRAFLPIVTPLMGNEVSNIWLDFTSFFAGFNVNEWTLCNP